MTVQPLMMGKNLKEAVKSFNFLGFTSKKENIGFSKGCFLDLGIKIEHKHDLIFSFTISEMVSYLHG